mgnify:CR=1 FL=1
MNILITGGAGFIGSHIALKLYEKGHEVTIIDDFSTGNNCFLENYKVIKCDINDFEKLKFKLSMEKFDLLFHLASKSILTESYDKYQKYYLTNVNGTENIMKLCNKLKIQKVIFSSSASVYGNLYSRPIKECDLTNPSNPYGSTKLKAEELIKDLGKEYNIDSIIFRFFNACGGDPKLRIGENHNPETHLIPSLIRNSLSKKKESFEVFGNKFNTNDGFAIRDYLNVMDICSAFIKGMFWLLNNRGHNIFNLGSNKGFSVKQIINECEIVIKKNINYKIKPRRKGEPDYLLSDISKATNVLKWKPKYSTIGEIIKTSYLWQSKIFKDE